MVAAGWGIFLPIIANSPTAYKPGGGIFLIGNHMLRGEVRGWSSKHLKVRTLQIAKSGPFGYGGSFLGCIPCEKYTSHLYHQIQNLTDVLLSKGDLFVIYDQAWDTHNVIAFF